MVEAYGMSNRDPEYLRKANDGTPEYNPVVLKSFRKLQIRTSIYETPPERGSGLRLAIYQAEANWGPGVLARNLERLADAIEKAADHGSQLLVFPELYLSGYTLDPDEAQATSEPASGPAISACQDLASKYGIALLVPYGEKTESGGKTQCFDSIAVIHESGKLLDSYKKTHLYGQQERDNWTPGISDFPVHNIHDFPVGVLNCYECEFPELVRILALKGAKLVVGPTAADSYYRLPDGTRSKVPYPDVAKVVFPAHAWCNNLFFAYANRCGFEERDGEVWHYRGNSIVYGPHGDVMVEAAHEQDTLLIADCVPAYYGMTHPAPNYFYLKDRRPELYGMLTSNDASFLNVTGKDLNEQTDLFSGRYHYGA